MGEAPEAVFQAWSESEEEADYQYQKYQARQARDEDY